MVVSGSLFAGDSTRGGTDQMQADRMNRSSRRRTGAARVVLAAALAALAAALLPAAAGARAIEGEYVVVLEDGVDAGAVARDHGRRSGVDVFDTYTHALEGYAARLSPGALRSVRADERVLSVTENRTVELAAQTLPTGINRMDADLSSTRSGDGSGSVDVAVAVIDTGVDTTHPDLNVVGGTNCYTPGSPDFDDVHGHGSGLGGIIGAYDNGIGAVGVAPGARLWSVKAFSDAGYGSFASVICGVEWVAANGQALGIKAANMSFGTAGTDDHNCGNTDGDAVHKAICGMVATGITPVAAAGNGARDFAAGAPARFDEVLAVTGIADYDGKPGGLARSTCQSGTDDRYFELKRGSGSNFAVLEEDKVHTIAAPMVCIYTTAPAGGYATLKWGTSYAAPHAAGVVALCAANGACAGLTPRQIIQKLRADAEVYTRANPSWGFTGDPTRPVTGRYYGFLTRAAGY